MKPGRTNKGVLTRTLRETIGRQLPICPLCGSHDPAWKFRYKIDFPEGRIQFRCGECDSVYSVTQTDLMGIPKLQKNRNFIVRLYTWPLAAVKNLKKKIHGKEASITYVKIEDFGYVTDSSVRNGQEVPLHTLQRIASSFR